MGYTNDGSEGTNNYVDSTLFPTGFWWGCPWYGTEKGTNSEGQTLRFLSSNSSQEIAGKHTWQHLFNEFPHGGHLPLLEETHIRRMWCHWRDKDGRHFVIESQAPNWGLRIQNNDGVHRALVSPPWAEQLRLI